MLKPILKFLQIPSLENFTSRKIILIFMIAVAIGYVTTISIRLSKTAIKRAKNKIAKREKIESELRKLNQNLENRVLERTTQLESYIFQSKELENVIHLSDSLNFAEEIITFGRDYEYKPIVHLGLTLKKYANPF